VLRALARGDSPDMDQAVRRWLQWRLLIDRDGRLGIPVFGRWLLEREYD
jgi:hypothetical protein